MQQASTHPAPALRKVTHLTFILIAVNVLVYVLLQTHGGPTFENLIAFGAKENGLIAQGDLYRLFFPMFLHAHPLHLAVNMYGLYQVGRYLELLAGARNLFLVYLFAGISGNCCSFAFTRSLSVGASGSLFGILLTLYVVQKYEQKMAQKLDEPIPKNSLGTVILLNAVISFVIPNIDWACHLGGAIAGIFCGLAIVMSYHWKLRFHQSARYRMTDSGIIKQKIYEREGFYYLLLFIVNILFLSTWKRIGMEQKAFGNGVLASSKNEILTRNSESLRQFERLLTSPKSDTNPEKLFDGALNLHKMRKFASAAKVYEVLEILNQQKLGSEDFKSQSMLHILTLLKNQAYRNEIPSEELFESLKLTAKNTEIVADLCLKPAHLFKTLGFFMLAGKLFECEFYLSSKSLNLASAVVESYWREEGDDKPEMFRFLNSVEQFEKGNE